MTDKIEKANRILHQNLFWIIPLFFVTMVVGFIQAMIQRDANNSEIILNTEKIQREIRSDTAVIPKIDSLKETLNKLK